MNNLGGNGSVMTDRNKILNFCIKIGLLIGGAVAFLPSHLHIYAVALPSVFLIFIFFKIRNSHPEYLLLLTVLFITGFLLAVLKYVELNASNYSDYEWLFDNIRVAVALSSSIMIAGMFLLRKRIVHKQ